MGEPEYRSQSAIVPRRDRPQPPFEPPVKAWWGAVIGAALAAYTALAFLSTMLDSPLGTLADMLVLLVAGALVAGAIGLLAAVIFALIQRSPTIWLGAIVGIVAVLAIYLGIMYAPTAGLIFGLTLVLPMALVGGAVGLVVQRGWKRGPVLFLALAVALLGLNAFWYMGPGTGARVVPVTGPAVAALVEPDPAQLGGYEVKALTYGSGTDKRRSEYAKNVTIKSEPVDLSPYATGWSRLRTWYWGFDATKAPINGRVWYPVGEGPFPLVLIVHGNHSMTEYSDGGYGYLGELLASKGYIVASIDENFLNNGPLDDRIGKRDNAARAWLLLQHLDFFKKLNATVGNDFYRRVDMGNIALIGHSRGGEAAYLAAVYNDLAFDPDDARIPLGFHFNIKSVVAIGPSDGQYRPADRLPPLQNVNYLLLQGASDGDMSVFEGLRQYGRVQFTAGSSRFKSVLYMYGANHTQFNTAWGRRDWPGLAGSLINLGPVISAEEQRQAAKVYISAFLGTTLRGRTEYQPLFQDYRVGLAWLPKTVYISQYEDGTMRHVSTFEEDIDVLTTTVPGGMQRGQNLKAWREEALRLRGGTSQENHALYLAWDRTGDNVPAYTIALPDGGARDWQLGATGVLTFALADSREPAAKQEPLDLTVELLDADGGGARLPLSRFAAILPPGMAPQLYKLGPLEGQVFGKQGPILQTYRIPLGEFAAGTHFDAAKLKTIRFLFDRTQAGAVYVDDVGFAPGLAR